AAARLQHDVLRRSQGQPAPQAVRPRVQDQAQRVPAVRVRPRLLQRRVVQGGGREGGAGRPAVAREGGGGQGARGPRGRVTLRAAQLARGPRPDVQLLPGDHDAQEQLRFRDHQPGRGRVHQAGDEAGGREAARLDQRLEDLAGRARLAVGAVGLVVERGLLSFVYERDETFQLLLTFAVVLMMEDAIRLTWGTAPRSTAGLYLVYGQTHLLGATVPVYNLIVIAASLAIAVAIGWLLTRTTFGRIVRATADNREMAAALGVDLRRGYAKGFT